MAPALTNGFISGPPRRFLRHLDRDDALKRRPVASTPMFFSMASGPGSSMTRASVKTFEIDWMENE